MQLKKCTVESESWNWVKILNDIFNPTFGFVHIWVETKQHVLECIFSHCHVYCRICWFFIPVDYLKIILHM